MSRVLNKDLIVSVAMWIERFPAGFLQLTYGIKTGDDGVPTVKLDGETQCDVSAHIATLTGVTFNKGGRSLAKVVPTFRITPELRHRIFSEYGFYEPINVLQAYAMEEAGLEYGQVSMLFEGTWPKKWLDGEEAPLSMAEPTSREQRFLPTPTEAVKVLLRIKKYGFQSS